MDAISFLHRVHAVSKLSCEPRECGFGLNSLPGDCRDHVRADRDALDSQRDELYRLDDHGDRLLLLDGAGAAGLTAIDRCCECGLKFRCGTARDRAATCAWCAICSGSKRRSGQAGTPRIARGRIRVQPRAERSDTADSESEVRHARRSSVSCDALASRRGIRDHSRSGYCLLHAGPAPADSRRMVDMVQGFSSNGGPGREA